jgi:transketolase
LTKKALGWPWEEPFHVPPEALARFRAAIDRGGRAQGDWALQLAAWGKQYPDLATEWRQSFALELPVGWDSDLPAWKAGDSESTRVAGGAALNAIAAKVPSLLGGDADLSESTKTTLKNGGDFDGATGRGRNLHFGVREHAMAGAANGMAYHGGVRPFVATFFQFSDYMRPSVRLAALSELPVLFVWTHDSVGLGEDGPTHQPVEHLMSLRAVPGLTLIRPGDANEAVEAWRAAMEHREGPVGLVLSRQKMPVLDRGKLGPATGLAKGAYVLAEASGGSPRVILIASGSELSLAVDARAALEAGGVPARVVSMPCWKFFEAQPAAYRESVLPKAVRARLAIEAGATLGWWRYVGDSGGVVGIDRFGASAPGETVLSELGFTVANIVAKAKALLS